MRKAPFILTLILLLNFFVSIVFACLWIDRSISLGYARSDAEAESRMARNMIVLLLKEWRGMNDDEVLKKMTAASKKAERQEVVIKKEGAVIWYDEAAFTFINGRLQKIGE